ncbi:MAG: hypothetical protein NZ455_08380 [Bacteroidia bacterium]|nr:hypothetical protein [Bacteroidia bacterium]MDW8345500.1 hypothetical protein [Bacteroidia bacterium]
MACTALRLFYTLQYPLLLGDGYEYHQSAVNILKYGTFSRSEVEPVVPTYTRVPGYSLFLAGIYCLIDIEYKYALYVQVFLSTITVYWAYRLIVESGIPHAQRVAYLFLGIHAIYFRADIFVNHILSETLTTFITVGVAYFILCKKNFYWAAILIGYGTITRVDMVTLPVFVLLFLWTYRRKYSFSLRKMSIVFFLMLLPISIWTLRNAAIFKIFMPLSAPFPVENVSKSGFALWCKTWITQEKEMQKGHWSIMFCEYQDFGQADIPTYAFTSEQEQKDILQIQSAINQTHIYTAQMDSVFRYYAYKHIRENPLKVLLLNPIFTGWYLWVHTGSEYFWFVQGIGLSDAVKNPFTFQNALKIGLSAIYLFLLCAAVIGFISCIGYRFWQYDTLVLLLLFWMHRTTFYMFFFLPEHRYMTSVIWIVWIWSAIGIVFSLDLLRLKVSKVIQR